MEVINCVFRQTYEHQYCYDEETLILHLKEAGFESAEPKKKFGEGEIPDLLIDQKDRACESLYAEAKKSPVAPDSD